MCLIIINIWFVVQVGGFFFPLKSGKHVLQSLSTDYSMLRESRLGYRPHLNNPKAEVYSKFFYTRLTVVKHFETDGVSKKVVHASFHTQGITQGTGKWISFRSLPGHRIRFDVVISLRR
ncbi:MAG: hypothetical protein C5B58_15170 [Acidobacteria bacterium]|nr:MAG: hypothetical protein C5B58_15170 [Acidobacteriota bacterium]